MTRSSPPPPPEATLHAEEDDESPPQTPSRLLVFERPRRQDDMAKLGRVEEFLKLLLESYRDLPRLLEADARAQYNAILTGRVFFSTLLTREHRLLRERPG